MMTDRRAPCCWAGKSGRWEPAEGHLQEPGQRRCQLELQVVMEMVRGWIWNVF